MHGLHLDTARMLAARSSRRVVKSRAHVLVGLEGQCVVLRSSHDASGESLMSTWSAAMMVMPSGIIYPLEGSCEAFVDRSWCALCESLRSVSGSNDDSVCDANFLPWGRCLGAIDPLMVTLMSRFERGGCGGGGTDLWRHSLP